MNRKTKLVLWALPLFVLIVALAWAKWKADNPPATQFDLDARKRLLNAKEVHIARNGGYVHNLSAEEKKEVASHLWIVQSEVGHSISFAIQLDWLSPKGVEKVYVGVSRYDRNVKSEDTYSINSNPRWSVPSGFRVHPATSHYLVHWFDQHPEVDKKVGYRE